MQFFHFRLDEEISKDAEFSFHQCKHKQDCLVSEGGWVGYKILVQHTDTASCGTL